MSWITINDNIATLKMIHAAMAVTHCAKPDREAEPMTCPDCMEKVLLAALAVADRKPRSE